MKQMIPIAMIYFNKYSKICPRHVIKSTKSILEINEIFYILFFVLSSKSATCFYS